MLYVENKISDNVSQLLWTHTTFVSISESTVSQHLIQYSFVVHAILYNEWFYMKISKNLLVSYAKKNVTNFAKCVPIRISYRLNLCFKANVIYINIGMFASDRMISPKKAHEPFCQNIWNALTNSNHNDKIITFILYASENSHMKGYFIQHAQ